jgi:hypothetical protein
MLSTTSLYDLSLLKPDAIFTLKRLTGCDMQVGKVQVPVEMLEWEERYHNLARIEEGTEAVGAWRDAFTGVNGVYVVSGRAKDVIERFDPDLHQFFWCLCAPNAVSRSTGPGSS